MQLNKNKLIHSCFTLIFVFVLQLTAAAQTAVQSQPSPSNRIGKGVSPVAEYDPQNAPLVERPAGTRRPFGDFFGTGRTSFAVSNRFNPGPVNWKLQSNGSAESRSFAWGRDDFNYTDIINPDYFDGDDKTDVAVWRRNLQDNTGTYFINPSTAPNSMQAFPMGVSTDFANKSSADYDGDGRDDMTVVRNVNNAWVWYYLRSSDNSYGAIQFGVAGAGAGTDSPQTGADYNGDGRADLTVIRRNADGTATYYIGDSVTGQIILVQQWGLATSDISVTGDFLGDARADFAVWRGFSATGNGVWYIKENGGDQIVTIPFGIAGINGTDRAIRGDYNGDGKDDIAIYRRHRGTNAPDNNTFYWLNSPNFDTLGAYKFGELGDGPIAVQ